MPPRLTPELRATLEQMVRKQVMISKEKEEDEIHTITRPYLAWVNHVLFLHGF